MTCDFGDVGQGRRGGDIIRSDMIKGRVCPEGVKDILREACRMMPRHVVGVVRVGARFATCHGDAEFGGRARYIL